MITKCRGCGIQVDPYAEIEDMCHYRMDAKNRWHCDYYCKECADKMVKLLRENRERKDDA